MVMSLGDSSSLLDNFRGVMSCRFHRLTVQRSEFPVEIRLILQILNLLYELVLHLIIDVQGLKALADLQLQKVVGLLDFPNVHLLQL